MPSTAGSSQPLLRAVLFTISHTLYLSASRPPASVPPELPTDVVTPEPFNPVVDAIGSTIERFLTFNTILEVAFSLLTLIPDHLSRLLPSFVDPSAYSPSVTPAARPELYVGLALLVVGHMIRRHCYAQLGNYFTYSIRIRQGHRLVKTGLYAYLRHPAYVGAVTTMTAAGLMVAASARDGALACWAPRVLLRTIGGAPAESGAGLGVAWWGFWVLMPVYMIVARVPGEERVMREKFGEEYREWEKRTWKCVPGVW